MDMDMDMGKEKLTFALIKKELMKIAVRNIVGLFVV